MFLYCFSRKQFETTKYDDIIIEINRDGGDVYLTEEDIYSWFKRHKIEVIGSNVSTLNTTMIERVLRSNIYIKSVDVYKIGNTSLRVHIKQRVPMIKLRDIYGNFFVIDNDGVIIPYNTKYPLKLIYCSGDIIFKNLYYGLNINHLSSDNRSLLDLKKFNKELSPNIKSKEEAYKNGKSDILYKDSAIYIIYENSQSYKMDLDDMRNLVELKDIYNLCTYVHGDDFLNSLFVQVYLDKNNEYTFVTNIGGHLIKFGKLHYEEKTVEYGYVEDDFSIQTRLTKLKAFYEKGISQKGWNIYKIVDLRYKGQIVCTKR